ncbi:MAG: acyl-CoA dehydrogenase family protein [Desulfobacterales bacterium]|nr:acyl-CoA dehydrogenase family protein [Desulfobacterales bacterium]
MNILQYSEEHNEFRARLQSFLEKEVIPFVDEWEKDKIIPRDIWRKMGKAGFLCPLVPKEYGGIGGDFLHSAIVSEELAKTNHCGLSASLHSDIIVPYILSYGTEEQKQKYIPGCVSGDIVTAVAMTEPSAGSDLASMVTVAVEDGDNIVISGSKTFISNGIYSDLVILAAKDEGIDDPHRAISLYLVEKDTPGFKKGKKLDKMGFYSQDTSELFFSNCVIPKTNRLGEKGMGFLMLMSKLQQERLVVTMGAIFGSEFALNWTIDYCKKNFEGRKPISKYQANQFTLVELMTQVKIGKVFVEKLISEHMEGKNVVVETSMAKYWTTDLLKNLTDKCLDLIGDFATLEKCPIARGFRDARVMPIFAGTNEIMKSIAAKFMGL